MECPYCKEEIKTGAVKCPICGEFLNLSRKVIGLFTGVLTICVSIGSLGIAYLQYVDKVAAVDEKEKAIIEKEKEKGLKTQAMKFLTSEKAIDNSTLLSDVKEELRQSKKLIISSRDEKVRKIQEQIAVKIEDGNNALDEGILDEAEKHYQKAAELERKEPKIEIPAISNSLGYIHLQKRDYRKAKQEFERALELNPEDQIAQKGLIYSEILEKKQK